MISTCARRKSSRDNGHLPTRATSLTLGHDTHTGQLTKLLEFGSQPLLVDVPRQVANEEVGRGTLSWLLSLRLLLGRGGLLVSLALLGVLGLLLLVRVRVRAVRAGLVVRVVRVIRVVRRLLR